MAFNTLLTDSLGLNGIPQYFDATGTPKPLIGDKAPFTQIVDGTSAVLFTSTNPGRINLSSPLPAGTNSIGSVTVISLPALPAGTNTIGSMTVAGSSTQDVPLLTAASVTGMGAAQAVGGFKTLRLETWGTGTYTVQIEVNTSNGSGTYYAVQPKNLTTLTFASNITAAGIYDIDVAGFSNVQANLTAISGGIPEVASLAVTAAPTSSGNVIVTLDGVASNVAVQAGVAEVASLQITNATGATADGNVTVTLDGIDTTVAVLATDNTSTLVATKIRGTTFTGWATGGAGNTVTFTATVVGSKVDAAYNAGTTGATGTMTTTTQGVNADAAAGVATKIRGTTFAGWATSGTGTTVTFTSNTNGARSDATYNAGTTGAIGAMTTTTQGVTVSVSVKGKLVA